MLIQFSVENFLSFKTQSTLSLEKGQRLRKHNESHTMEINNVGLLKNIIIFGPNGSGKSNLLAAFNNFRMMILKPTQTINNKLQYIPFLLDESSKKEPTSFEVEFIVNGIQYFYQISFNTKKIIKEELCIYTKNKYETYFDRHEGTFSFVPENTEKLSLKTRPNSLFLFNLQNENDFHAKNVIEWFENYLIFADNSSIDDYIYLLEDEKYKKMFVDFLNFADFNIIDIEVKVSKNKISGDTLRLFHDFVKSLSDTVQIQLPEELDGNAETIKNELFTIYREYNSEGEVIGKTALPVDLESAGTKKMIKIALCMLASIESPGKVLFFDEFDDSFHLNLSKALIKIFNTKSNKNQFVLTSHELQLLECELRKDQIYFASKDFDGESQIYSIFDFLDYNSRTDISYLSHYLNGEFGAIPKVHINSILDLLENQYQNVDGEDGV